MLPQEAEPLSEEHLVALAHFGRALLQRPEGKAVSHKEALEMACQLAQRWLHPDTEPVAGLEGITGNNR